MLIDPTTFLKLLDKLTDLAKYSTSLSQGKTLATYLILKEWDDRTGASRLWLLRRNPTWVRPGGGRQKMSVNLDKPTADDAESMYHANIILNFMDDVALALESKLITLDTIRDDLIPTLDVWWARTAPVRELVEKDKAFRRTPGWNRASKLLEDTSGSRVKTVFHSKNKHQ